MLKIPHMWSSISSRNPQIRESLVVLNSDLRKILSGEHLVVFDLQKIDYLCIFRWTIRKV